MTTSHIRQPLARRGGSSFYRDTRPRVAATLCGAPVTAQDVDYRTAGTKRFQASQWLASTCPACQARRAEGQQ